MNARQLIILLIAALNGSAVMFMEVLYPRISMTWFGNMLHVWSAMLIASLSCFALGYYLAGKIKQMALSYERWLYVSLLVVAGLIFLFLPHSSAMFTAFLGLDEGIACLLASFLLMLPTITVFASTSTLLVGMMQGNEEKGKLYSSAIFGVSTLVGVVAIVLVGAYLIPFKGVQFASYVAAGITFSSAALFTIASRKD